MNYERLAIIMIIWIISIGLFGYNYDHMDNYERLLPPNNYDDCIHHSNGPLLRVNRKMMMTALSIFLYVSKPIVIIFGRIFPAINQLFKVPKVSQGFDSPPITKRHLEGLGKSDW